MPDRRPDALTDNRIAQDRVMAERHHGFDLAARDITPKYHRAHFAVVGEGSRAAQGRYRQHYDQIDWSA